MLEKVVGGTVIESVVVTGTDTVSALVTVIFWVKVVGTKLVMFRVKKISVVNVV